MEICFDFVDNTEGGLDVARELMLSIYQKCVLVDAERYINDEDQNFADTVLCRCLSWFLAS
jgi:hypothetical protein